MLCAAALAQQTIGRVPVQDASVTGTLEVNEGLATVRGGASVVANDRTAKLSLERGGVVEVCATSSLHVTSGAQGGDMAPLLFALDRGAIEMRTLLGARDALITPDLRFSVPTGGRVDLRVRVTSNGDTCVENREVGAPTIEVVEQFSDGRYLVSGGQHVLFEHGSIREVVDRETSPCGCPPVQVMSLAEKGVTVAPRDAARAGGQAAQKVEEHPFPAAESQGLARTGVVAASPQAQPGQVQAQVAATMAYGAGGDSARTEASAANGTPPANGTGETLAPGGGGTGGASGAGGTGGGAAAARSPQPAVPVATPPAAAPVEVKAPPPPAPPGATDIAHRLGRFFKRIFGAR